MEKNDSLVGSMYREELAANGSVLWKRPKMHVLSEPSFGLL